MKTRLVTAGVGAAWEAALVQACQAGQVGAQVLHRCYDLGDLLSAYTFTCRLAYGFTCRSAEASVPVRLS